MTLVFFCGPELPLLAFRYAAWCWYQEQDMANNSKAWERRALDLHQLLVDIESIEDVPTPPPYALRVRELARERVAIIKDGKLQQRWSWRRAAELLWNLLDHIDTLSDSMRPRQTKYYRRVMDIVPLRFDILNPDAG